MGVSAGLLGAFAGALIVTFLVTRASIRFTGRTRKGAFRTFFIGLVVTWGFRVTMWQVLDNGYGDISISLVSYALALLIWLVRDYRNAELAPSQTVTDGTIASRQPMRSRLNTTLDSPFKRIAALVAGIGFVMLLIGWLQIVARYVECSSCIHVMVDHLLFKDEDYMLFTYGAYLLFIGLMGSVLYKKGIGRVVKWIKTGTTS